MDLYEQNFPRLKAVAEEVARLRVESLRDEFFKFADTNLSSEDMRSFADPDMQFILNQAIEVSARSSFDYTKIILALLLTKRIKNTTQERKRLAYNGAIQTVGKLTANHIRLLILSILLYDHLRSLKVQSWSDLNNYYMSKVLPMLDFENSYIDYTHLAYCGCCSLEISWGATSYAQIIKNQFKYLFPQLADKKDEQLYIETEIRTNLELGDELIKLWNKSYFWGMNLTTTGYIIAVIGYSTLTQDYGLLDEDELFEQ